MHDHSVLPPLGTDLLAKVIARQQQQQASRSNSTQDNISATLPTALTPLSIFDQVYIPPQERKLPPTQYLAPATQGAKPLGPSINSNAAELKQYLDATQTTPNPYTAAQHSVNIVDRFQLHYANLDQQKELEQRGKKQEPITEPVYENAKTLND